MLVPKNKAHSFFLGFVFHGEGRLGYGHQNPAAHGGKRSCMGWRRSFLLHLLNLLVLSGD